MPKREQSTARNIGWESLISPDGYKLEVIPESQHTSASAQANMFHIWCAKSIAISQWTLYVCLLIVSFHRDFISFLSIWKVELYGFVMGATFLMFVSLCLKMLKRRFVAFFDKNKILFYLK